MDLSATLQQAQLPDLDARRAAEGQLKVWEDQSLAQFMLALAGQLAGEQLDANSRKLAGLHLKNLISARDATTAEAKRLRYFQSIKEACLNVLRSPTPQAAQTGAQVVSQLGLLELAQQQWPDLLGRLLHNMTATDVANGDLCKTATLETLGYLCEELDENVIAEAETNQILTAIVDGMMEAQAAPVRVAAAQALLNSLGFTQHNFENEAERTMIMQVVCAASKSPNERLRVIAFESLARVASLYYGKLPQYIDIIYQLTLAAIREDKSVQGTMMAIEFWSTLCEEEMELLEEEEEDGGGGATKCLRYVEQAAANIVPVLLNHTLTRQDEDGDEDAWDVSAAGAVCLGLVSQTVGDAIVPDVLGFVEANILNPEWRRREASIMAFGQILEGPKQATLSVPVQKVMAVLVKSLGDGHPLVRDTTAWTIARICELHAQQIPAECLHPLVERLLTALERDTPRVAAQACFAVHNLAQAVDQSSSSSSSGQDTNALSGFAQPLLKQLLAATERPDWAEHNLRGQAYEAINMVIQNHALDTRPVVRDVLQCVLQRLHDTFARSLQTSDDRDDRDQLQSLLCSVIQVITRGIDKDIGPFADHVMGLLLQVINNQNAVASEEAFMAIGALATVSDRAFEKYMPDLFPFLIKGLRNYAEWQVCSAAVGTTGDICRALESRILPYCDDIVRCLLEDLQNPELSRAVKPSVLGCFGDLCLAIGGAFDKYLHHTLQMLEQAARTTVPNTDEELVEYLNVLREGILEGYTGLIQGLADGRKVVVSDSRNSLCDDDEAMAMAKSVIGIIGDLADALVTNVHDVKPFFNAPFVRDLLDKSAKTQSLVEIATWALTKLQPYN